MRKLSWAGLTDVGKKRTGNEDAFVVDADLGMFVVCDGMGGHASGEVASAMTTEEIHVFFRNRYDGEKSLPYKGEPGATMGELVVSNAIQHANDKVYIAGMRDSKLEGMGTTVVAVSEHDDKLIVTHVGDSRIYRYRQGALEQVTRDHSLLNHKIDLGELKTEEEINGFKHGNVIVRAIGLKDYVRPETAIHERFPGDIYLLCSDGLSDMVDDWSIENILDAHQDDLDEACRILVRMANDRGGKDNITCVLVRVDDEFEELETMETEGLEMDVGLREETTEPARKAFVLEDEGGEAAEEEGDFRDFTEEDDDRTAPHTPVFAWDDDEIPAPPTPASRVRPTQPKVQPAAAEMRRRMQPTEELPSIVVDDDEEPSIVIDDES